MTLTRFLTAVAGLALFLGACSTGGQRVQTHGTVIAQSRDFVGVIAADEPRAAQVGREILRRGGTAADAATAMYFVLTATLPSRVGLGAGGACLVREGERTAVLDFPIVAGAQGGALPPSLRAMAALQARYGLLRWGELVNSGERLARFGTSVSRVFARDLARAQGLVDSALLSRFARRDGQLLREGDLLSQFELASVLAGLRRQGAGYLYNGPLTAHFARAATQAGFPLSASDLRGYVPTFGPTDEIEVGRMRLITPRTQAGVAVGLASAVIESLGQDATDPAVVAQALRRAWSLAPNWLTEGGATLDDILKADLSSFPPVPAQGHDSFAAGFTVIDRFEGAVACQFRLNGLFGAGRMVAGVVMGQPAQTPAPDPLAALMVLNQANGDLRFIGATSGAAPAVSALTQMAATAKNGTDFEVKKNNPAKGVAVNAVGCVRPVRGQKNCTGFSSRGLSLQ